MFICFCVYYTPPLSLFPFLYLYLSPQYKVTHKQLVLLMGAFAAYFSGNHKKVDTLLKELKAKLDQERQSQDPPAWLEELPSARELHNQG